MDIEDIDSPFIIKKQSKQSAGGAWKKQKSNKSTNVEPLVLTEGDFGEIDDIVHVATKEMWGNIEDQYREILTKVQQGLKELQVHTSVIQASMVQTSVNQASVVPSTSKLTADLQAVHLPEGSLHVGVAEERESAQKLKNLSLNLVTLPPQMLHKLHQGVTNELNIWEQCQQLEDAITKACSEISKLQIPAEAASAENIQKLATTVRESKGEVGKVRFELQMKLQPTTPSKVREKHKVSIKAATTKITTIV